MESGTEEKKTWEEVLRKMLPPGAPLPDGKQFDYSIAVEYQGPPVSYELPKAEPLHEDLLSIPTSSMVSVSGASPSSVSELSVPVLPVASKVPRFSRYNNGGSGEGSISTSGMQIEPEEEEREESDYRGRGDETEASSSAQKPKRAAVVTFNTEEDCDRDDTDDELSSSRSGVADHAQSTSPVLVQDWGKEKKKGVCSRCGKGNWLKEREACLVCDAKYCSNCLLKTMGSMPEGRKCVGCIGQPIDESKRSSLGKCSRMLSRICSPLEVRQIMKVEKECLANQLRPEQIIVNGRALRQEELAELLSCPIPPLKLKPGKYWYDKDSGLWGKVVVIPSAAK